MEPENRPVKESMRHLPIDEIIFAAKSGFLSRRLWLEFFSNLSASRNSRVWRSLIERGYFLRHPSSRAGDVLVPNRRSELVKRLARNTVAAPPFISQLDHDEVCSRIALGLVRSGLILSYMTEAEQKRQFFGKNRSFRESTAVKFPDLLLAANGRDGKKNIAIEVELSKKNPKRYRDIFRAYREKRECNMVIFLARSDAIFDALSRAMKDVTYPTWERPVGYGFVDEWTKSPGSAAIHLNNGRTTLGQLLVRQTIESAVKH